MIDRVSFIESVSGIQYPEMIVKFFDHFLALKEIVEESGSVAVNPVQDPDSISFNITFSDSKSKNNALQHINQGSVIDIYNRPISVNLEVISEKEIRINLH